jgi:hypothetical protein
MQQDTNGRVQFEYRSELSDIEKCIQIAKESGQLSGSEQDTAERLADILETMWYSW